MAFDGLFEQEMAFVPGEAAKFPSGGGVFLLTDAEDRIVQLGAGADLRRALRNRLLEEQQPAPAQQEPPPSDAVPAEPPEATPASSGKRKLKLAEVVRHIRWRSAHSQFEVDLAYYRLARQLMPDRYLKQVGFGPAWFLNIEAEGAIPRLTVGKLLRPGVGADLGPFGSQADANRFLQILQDALDLCRYEHILEQAPHGQACAYFEMGRCPAPCDGSVPMEEYRGRVRRALAFAARDREPLYAELTRAMQKAASDLAYERAGALKQRLERAQGIEHEAFRFVCRVDALSYLILQRGRGRTRVMPFFMWSGVMEDGESVHMRDLQAAVPQWIARLQAGPSAPVDQHHPRERSELIALLTHYLFRREPPGLFLAAGALTDSAGVAAQAAEHFARAPKAEAPGAGDQAPSPASGSA